MTDRIAYLLRTEAGGVDGRDHTDRGGVLIAASFDKAVLEKRKGNDSRYRIEAIVITEDDARKEALAKLSPLDRLVLGVED